MKINYRWKLTITNNISKIKRMKDKMIWKINKKMIMIRINNHVAQLIIQMNSA